MTLDFNDNHEITLSILHEDQPYLLWSSGVRFVFVMRGTVSALLHGQTHTLSPAGFCLIHPLELCQISCFADSKALMVYIPQDYIRLSGFTNSAWDCLAVDAQASPQTICDELRRLFAAHPEWRIIHGHYSGFGMFYNPVARRAGIPVRCGHSHNTAYEPNLVGRLDRFMSSFFSAGLTDRFACSEKAGQMLYGSKPFTVVPNGIDTARFAARDPQRRALLRGELGVTDQEILFGHVGRFSAQKNHPGLLKIFAAVRARLPKARLVLLGGGEPAYIEKMQALAQELALGDSVIFAGVRSNIQSFYDAMDAFMLPSLFEGLPVVLVEAQTAGLPCFVSDTVDPGAAFTDRVRFLPLQDTGAWADAIAAASFRRDPQAREKAVRAGYDIHTSAAVLQEFYLRRYAEVTK